MIHHIKKSFQIHIDGIFVSLVDIFLTPLQGFVSSKTGAKAKTIGAEVPFIKRREDL